LIADGAAKSVRGSMRWSSSVPTASRVPLGAEGLPVVARLAPRPDDGVLLAAGDEALIVRRAGDPVVVETSLDVGTMASARRPEAPLIVNFLLDRVLGGGLLDAVASVDRGAAASRVAPVGRAEATSRPADRGVVRVRDATRALLAAAWLVLVWEIVALFRQWRRSRSRTEAVPA
jgi:hypothetical protein